MISLFFILIRGALIRNRAFPSTAAFVARLAIVSKASIYSGLQSGYPL